MDRSCDPLWSTRISVACETGRQCLAPMRYEIRNVPWTAERRDSAPGFEAVADSAQSLQVSGMTRVAFDFLPRAPNKDINRSRRHEGAYLPNGFKKLIAREYSSTVKG